MSRFNVMPHATGRSTDPATADNVPVHTSINFERDTFDGPDDGTGIRNISTGKTKVSITIASWNRASDKIREYRITVDNDELGRLTERPLDHEDAEWLRNIGARP